MFSDKNLFYSEDSGKMHSSSPKKDLLEPTYENFNHMKTGLSNLFGRQAFQMQFACDARAQELNEPSLSTFTEWDSYKPPKILELTQE